MLTIDELIEKRKRSGISQTELALVVGMFPSNISRLESGILDCKISTLELINAGLDIIKANRRRETTGFIVIDILDFKNTLYRSMIPEIDRREAIGEFAGNVKDLTESLVCLVVEEANKDVS